MEIDRGQPGQTPSTKKLLILSININVMLPV
jgi:hypothetical protein